MYNNMKMLFYHVRNNSRSQRKARAWKHLGDLYLLSGQCAKSLSAYEHAIRNTKKKNDHLWLGASLEGQACTAAVMRLHKDLLPTQVPSGSRSAQSSPLLGNEGQFLKARSLSQRRFRNSATPDLAERRNGVLIQDIKRNLSSSNQELYSEVMQLDLTKSPSPTPVRWSAKDHFDNPSSLIQEFSLNNHPPETTDNGLSRQIHVSMTTPELPPSPETQLSGEDDLSDGEEEEMVLEEDVDGLFSKELEKDYTITKYNEALAAYKKVHFIDIATTCIY